MLTETNSSNDLLNEIIRLDLFSMQKIENGTRSPVTDRARLYAGLINELIADANREGFHVLDNDSRIDEPLDQVFVEKAPCDQLGNGCTCEECTNQIADVAGWESVDTTVYDGTPVSPDHEFEDDCERVPSVELQQQVETLAHATMLEYLAMGDDNTPTEWPREAYARDSFRHSWPNECWAVYRDYISAQCAEM
jgi:hypothetical protein